MADSSLATRWRQVLGDSNWDGLLDALDSELRRETIRYGEFVQAVYDGIDSGKSSAFRYFSHFGKSTLFSSVGLGHKVGYNITRYLYSTQESDGLLEDVFGDTSSVWMGYVAVSNDAETLRLGRRDVVVAFRGTLRGIEWIYNVRMPLVPFDTGSTEQVPMVHKGFLSLYQSFEAHSTFGSKSLRQQVLDEIHRLLEVHHEEDVSVTVVGHSLGGALATLCAYDIASSGVVANVTAFTYASPRVGNLQFKENADRVVKILRIVDKRDIVPMLPPSSFILDSSEYSYHHAGVELKVDGSLSPFLKDAHLLEFGKPHNLEGYMHTLAGISGTSKPEAEEYHGAAAIEVPIRGVWALGLLSTTVTGLIKYVATFDDDGEDDHKAISHIQDLLLDDVPKFLASFAAPQSTHGASFELVEKRSIALLNKGQDLLKEKYNIPAEWWNVANKGMIQNSEHEWVFRQTPVDDPDFM